MLNNRPEYFNSKMEDEIQSAKHKGWNDCNSYYYDLINKQPRVNIEQYAHWEQVPYFDKKYGVFQCSDCKKEFLIIGGSPKENNYNYCPNCGCRMVEVDND